MGWNRVALSTVATVLVVAAWGCGPAQPPPTTGGGTGGGPTTAPEKLAAMPGECVDPLPDGDKRDATRPFGKHVQLDVRGDDLDGDGTPDIFVKPAWYCGEACNRSVYVARGTCGHYVGTFPSEDRYEVMETKSHGLKDLSTRPRKMDGGDAHCFNVILQFDGKEYQPAKRRECECKEKDAKCTAWE